MTFDQLVALLPCHSLEDFDLERKSADAEQLLSAWSALWHPVLIDSARSIPRWLPAASPPQEPSGHLIILPDCCEPLLPEGWLAQAEAAGACVLRNLPGRGEMIAAAFERLGEDRPDVDADLAADFLALGFCYLQVELLTRKQRYMSNLDETSLQTAMLAAVDEALRGDVSAARAQLQSAFDRLHEAREYFYPTEARLLDLTLVASSTLGAPLRTELAGGLPRNLLVSGEVVERMACDEPATLEALKQALADSRASLIGGEYDEIPLPLLDPEAIESHLRRGLGKYEAYLERRPMVFGRRRFGLSPALPSILDRNGFTGAFHCTLDDGQFPTGNQCRIQWEGIDGTTIETVACLPIDASRADSFLQITEKFGSAMNFDSTSALMFAHWPGKSSDWYDDMRRIAAYGSIFGIFSTVDAYLEETTSAGQQSHYKADQYRAPYLRQDVVAGRSDPISRWVRYFRRRAALGACESLQMLSTLCGTSEKKGESVGELAAAVEASLVAEDEPSSALDEKLAKTLQEPLAGFARSVTGDSASPQRGCLAVNPWSFSQQASISSTMDVPAMGFAWVGFGEQTPPVAPKRKGWFGWRRAPEPPPLAEENVLRNEFFEVRFDPHTGAIRTISDYQSRDPRLAQQIALRLPHGGQAEADVNYSIMAADELTVTSAGPLMGEIFACGRLMDHEGRRVAGFRQTTRARRGSRILELEIELDIDRQPGPNPWDSYYAVRFAWKDETSVLHRCVNLANLPTELMQFESPHFVDVVRGKQHTTLLGGLPYHRRLGLRKLDTLLVVQGESARLFRLGIGIDVPHPIGAALGFLSPPLVLPDQPPPPASTGWLFHLDCRNVLATHWEPLSSTVADDNSRGLTAPGDVAATASVDAGFRVRLLETDGRGVRLGLRCFRGVASARKINPGDVPPVDLTIEGDRVNVPIGPHQWIDVEVRFAPR